MNVLITDPVPAAGVESQQVRVELLPLSYEMTHVDGACGAAKYTDGVKESREGQDPLRFGQGPCEDCLQHDAAYQPDESKRLPDADKQFSAVEVVGRPRTAVLGIQPGSKSGTSKAD